jgi:hypothetical protein
MAFANDIEKIHILISPWGISKIATDNYPGNP